jgi:hypothetical protein
MRASYYPTTYYNPHAVLRPLRMLAALPTPAFAARVALFAKLMRQHVAFAPIEVIVEQDGRFVVADGHHRTAASLRCGYSHIPTLPYEFGDALRCGLFCHDQGRFRSAKSSGSSGGNLTNNPASRRNNPGSWCSGAQESLPQRFGL